MCYDLVIKLNRKNNERNHLILFRIFVLILCLIFYFINKIDFLFNFLDQFIILNHSDNFFIIIIIPSDIINKDFMTTKTILIFHQELSIEVRKSFEGCKRSKNNWFVFNCWNDRNCWGDQNYWDDWNEWVERNHDESQRM